MKQCSTCKELKPTSSFYKEKRSVDGYRGQCKSCVKFVKQAYFLNNREKELGKLKAWKIANPSKVKAGNIRNRYGLNEEQYSSLVQTQSNCCAICSKHQSLNVVDKRNNKPRDLSVDHEHATGRVRGLLCYFCNLAVGMLKDDISVAERLVEYLRESDCDKENKI